MKKKEPTLIIMAAGMGSRYGGLKQIDPITEDGDIIIDFSLYDAMMAGFKKVVFVIKEEMKDAIGQLIENRAGRFLDIEYAFQKLTDLPKGYEIPEGREKPWGTAHAIFAARNFVSGPFAVINADDYYAPSAFQSMYDFLTGERKEYEFAMVGYELKNTITENGHVSRGVCNIGDKGFLEDVVERTKIMKRDKGIAFTEDEGNTWTGLLDDTLVSMNFWGYTKDMMVELEKRFPQFLDDTLKNNPSKGEYLIPKVTDDLIQEGKATVKVLKSQDRWYGVTYKEDKEDVKAALQSMKDKGIYPDKFWA